MAHTGGSDPLPDITKQPLVTEFGTTKMDWTLLRDEWVTTNISLPLLAKKYGLKFRQVREVYEHQRWADDLRSYQTQIEDKLALRRADKAQAMVDKLSIIDEHIVDLSEKALDFLDKLIDDTIQERSTDVEKDKITVRDAIVNIKLAVDTMKSAYGNIRLAGGKSTINMGINVEPNLPPDELKRIEEEFKFLQSRDITNDDK